MSATSSVFSHQLFLFTDNCLLAFIFALPSRAINQIKEQERHQPKEQDKEEGADIPQFREDGVAVTCKSRNLGEYLLIGQAVNYCTRQKTE